MLQHCRRLERMPQGNVRLLICSVISIYRLSQELELVPFSAAHRLASAHSTSRSSSLSDLLPTRTVTKCGLASALASANHRDKFIKESRLQNCRSIAGSLTYIKGLADLVIS